MLGKLSVAATQACLLVGAVSLFCPPSQAQHAASSNIPAFDIDLSVSPGATARLGSQKLWIYVSYYGTPKPGVTPDARFGDIWRYGAFTVQGKSQTIHVGPDRYVIANTTGPLHIVINIELANGSHEPSLICDTFKGDSEDVAAGPVHLRCALSHEAERNGIGIETVPKSSADSYAIYSLLLPGGALDMVSPTKARDWSVADTTVNITDMNPAVPPDGLLKAPAENTKAFEQALRDFKFRQYERFHLTASGFSGTKPDLIDPQRVQEIRDSGQGGIVFFSAVYFNDNNTAALVYVNTWCANLCSAGQWVYLEKQGGQWVRRSGITVPGA